MAKQPVFLLHIRARFHINYATAREHSNKQICLVFFARYRIIVGYSSACPINLHSFARLMIDTHCSLSDSRPAAVFVTKLRAHVRLISVCITTLAVFAPEQGKCYALLGKLPVDVGIVRLGIRNESMLFCRVVQNLIKFFICHIIIKRP